MRTPDLRAISSHSGVSPRAVGSSAAERLGRVYVDSAALADRLGQLDQLRRVAPTSGVVDRRVREADGALFQALADQPSRAVELLLGQPAAPEPVGLQADRAVGDQVGRVDRHAPVVVGAHRGDAAHVGVFRGVSENARQPAPVEAVVGRGQRRERHSAQAEYLGRDPLPQPVGVLRVDQQAAFGVGVRVDEAGRYDHAGGVDDAARFGAGQTADRVYPVPDDAHVGPEAGRAGTVDDGAVGYQ